MADLPELSDSTKLKLALQWSTLLDTNHLTGEHFHWHERERDRLRRIAAQGPGPGPDWRNERAADETGVRQTVTVAEERFKALSGEYWRPWLNSGNGYEGFVEWLEELRRNVSAEVASIWNGGSNTIENWYERACGPAVEKSLAALVKEGTHRARVAEMKRLEGGAQPRGDSHKGTEAVPSIIGQLPKDALLRMEAATAAFMADYLPKVEREGNKSGPVHDMRVSPWAQIPEAERASAWRVGAMTGEALSHLALKLRAEALKNAAEGGFPKPDQAGAMQPGADKPNHTDAGPANHGTNPAASDGKRRKRGPKPDPDAASRVAEIVARVAPDGEWRPKLDDICEALDEAQIAFPPRWRKRCRSCDGWAAYDERANAVKAIEYRLEIAKQRKKVTPETLS